MKLKNLLIAAFVAMSAVPLFVGLQYLNETAREHDEEQFVRHLDSLADISKDRVLRVTERIREQTDLIANRTQLKMSLERWNRNNDPVELSGVRESIDDAITSLTHIQSIRVFDKGGTLVATAGDSASGNDEKVPRLSRETLALQRDRSDTLLERGQRIVLNNRLIGYIRISYFADFLNQLVSTRAGLGDTGEWLLAVRSSDNTALVVTPLKYTPGAAFERSISVGDSKSPIAQAFLGNERILQNTPDYRGVPVVAATRYLPDQGWAIVTKVDQSEVDELANQNQSVILVSEIVIILSAIGVGIALAIYISRPVEKLTDHTAKVADGVLKEPDIGNPSWYEAQQLTDHFSQMISSLRDLNETLQDKVEERTRELTHMNRELETLATRDHLTGLFNRRHFDKKFEEEFARSKRYKRELSVAVLDIDHFKSINDNYGHAVGDEVLKTIAEYTQSSIRESDVAARTGGEEFCILLPETNAQAAQAFLERFRHGVSELSFTADDRTFTVTCSIGVARCDEDSETREELLFRADESLYKAKNNGRNQVLLFRRQQS